MNRKAVIAFVIAVVLGTALLVVGRAWINDVGELHDRSERVIGTVKDGSLEFTTVSGRSIVVVLEDDCKFGEPPPGRGCLERFENGDEVLVWYDSADPTHTWVGTAPGGGGAAFVLYLGIVLTLIGSMYLWFIFVHPPLARWIARMKGNDEVPRTG